MSKLVLFMPDGTTVDLPLARERTMIGRRADNDVSLPNLAVSAEHAVVVTILADSFLEDLGSTNGTLVNGKPIAKHFLRDRDQIDIGRHKLVYCVDDETTLKSETVGLARINARDFGERVDLAKPFVRTRAEQPAATAELVDTGVSAPASESSAPRVPAAAASAPARMAPSVADTPRASARAAPLPPAPPSAPPPAAASASIKVLSGINAGVTIPLTKAETTIGRPGIQVASIVRAGARFRLKPVEGAAPPAVNGQPTGRDGIDLALGDVIEIAGTQLEFVEARRERTRDGADA